MERSEGAKHRNDLTDTVCIMVFGINVNKDGDNDE